MGSSGKSFDFKLETIMDKLSSFKGFSVRVKKHEEMILVTVEDLREHPEFSGHELVNGWSDIFQTLSGIGLDPSKAIVSLGCRSEAIKAGSRAMFNIGMVQLGWAYSTAHNPIPDHAAESAHAHAPSSRVLKRSGEQGSFPICRV